MKSNSPLSKKSKPRTLRDDLNNMTELVTRLVNVLENTQGSPSMLEDVTLTRAYPVETIAAIAARCAGATAFDRVEAAIQLVSVAESSASMGMQRRFIMRRVNAGHSEESAKRQFWEESKNRAEYRRKFEQVKEIAVRRNEIQKLEKSSSPHWSA